MVMNRCKLKRFTGNCHQEHAYSSSQVMESSSLDFKVLFFTLTYKICQLPVPPIVCESSHYKLPVPIPIPFVPLKCWSLFLSWFYPSLSHSFHLQLLWRMFKYFVVLWLLPVMWYYNRYKSSKLLQRKIREMVD